VAAATAAALRILRGAAQSDVSLRRRLAARGFTPAAARAAATEMGRLGYVDDNAFAGAVADRRLQRGYGRAAVAAELRARGVGEGPIDEALRRVGLDDERAAAAALAARFLERERARHGHDDPRSAGRVAAHLARRGYSGETIRAALRVAWSAAGRAAAAGISGADE
jgi:regulatory protein